MRSYSAILLSLAASALAYQVTSPSSSTVWSSTSSNTVSWERVSTDASNFTIVLASQGNAASGQVLAQNIDGTAGSTTVDPPSGGFPVGTGYQINLVKDSNDLTSIYAQSGQFNITQGTSSSASGSSTASGSKSSGATTTVSGSGSSASSSGQDLNPSSSGSASGSSSSSNAAAGSLLAGAQTGLLGFVALLGAFLA